MKCWEKKRYETKLEAQTALLNVWRAAGATREVPRKAYECDSCGAWHLTSWEEDLIPRRMHPRDRMANLWKTRRTRK